MNINTVSAVLSYALTGIFALEQSLPQSGLGTTKKQILLNGIEVMLKAATTATGTLASAGSNVGANTEISVITNAASTFIDSTVAALNKTKAAPASA